MDDASSLMTKDTFLHHPIISKLYCNSSSQIILGVRRRPLVVNGGGFVVTDSSQRIVFRVDGCGVLGSQGELILRDSGGQPLVFISRKGGLVQIVSFRKKWKGYRYDYDGSMEPAFTFTETDTTCLPMKKAIKIKTFPRRSKKDWDFEVRGSFPDRDCTIVDYNGAVVGQICAGSRDDETVAGNDVYRVVVTPWMDQAFVIAVIATLDNIHGESTRC